MRLFFFTAPQCETGSFRALEIVKKKPQLQRGAPEGIVDGGHC